MTDSSRSTRTSPPTRLALRYRRGSALIVIVAATLLCPLQGISARTAGAQAASSSSARRPEPHLVRRARQQRGGGGGLGPPRRRAASRVAALLPARRGVAVADGPTVAPPANSGSGAVVAAPSAESVQKQGVNKNVENDQQQQQQQQQQLGSAPPPPPSLRAMQSSSFLLVLSLAIVSLSPTPILIEELGPDKATKLLSTLAALAATLEIVLSPVLGATLDSLGRKPALVGAMMGISAVHAVVSAAAKPTPALICLARCVCAVSVAQFFVASQAVIGDVTASNPDRMGSYLSTQSALISGGFLVGVMAAGRLTALVGPSVTYGVSAIIAALAAVLTFLGMTETLRPEQRVPFEFRETRRRVLESPISAAHLLVGRGSKIRTLAVLLLLQSAPMFMGDVMQVFATKEWGLAPQGFANLIAIFGLSGIVANSAGSVLVQRMGVRRFTVLAILSSLCYPVGASFFAHRGAVFGAIGGFLGSAQTVGVIAALTARASAMGVRQGELAGGRASLMALMKIVCPVWYGGLYLWGRRVGVPQLPFMFNIVVTILAMLLAQQSLT